MSKPALLLALVFVPGCRREPPTAPNQVNVVVNQTVTLGTPLPNASPSPVAGAADKVIVGMTVTEIGGDGLRQFAVGESAVLTATPRNASGEDPCVGFPTLAACGAYTESDIRWFAGAGFGAECSGVAVACDLGTSGTNYNRRLRTLRPGTFTVQAQFRGLPPVSFTGQVQ